MLESKSRVLVGWRWRKLGMPLLRLCLWKPHLRLDFHYYSLIIFFLSQGSFCNILVCNLNDILYLFTILLLYMWFENPGHMYRGFDFICSELGYDSNRAGCVCWRGRAPKPGLERFGVRCSRTFLLRARGVYGYVLPGGASTVPTNTWHMEGPRASYDTVRS
jgi:hypothetical protein